MQTQTSQDTYDIEDLMNTNFNGYIKAMSTVAGFIEKSVNDDSTDIDASYLAVIEHVVRHVSTDSLDCEGARVMAVLENVLGPLRISWHGHERASGRRFITSYRRGCWPMSPGRVRACAFTGLCYDDFFLDFITQRCREGHSMRSTIAAMDQEKISLFDAEIEHATSDEAIVNHCRIRGFRFDINGSLC